MFDAEKLLGTVMREIVGSGSGYGKKKKKGKKKHVSTLVNGLKSGTGLMTAIGLGIGAYEILRSKSQPQQGTVSPASSGPPPIPPAVGGRGSGSTTGQPPAMVPPIPGHNIGVLSSQDIARRMLQVMIAAAHADGTMDEQEEQAVLDHLKDKGLDREERMFLFAEMHAPKPIEELVDGISDPSVAKAMYMVAASTVEIDTEAERHWFDELAARLGISRAIQQFIEEKE